MNCQLSDRPSEGASPTIVGERIFEFCLPPRERRGIVEMLNAFGAIRLDDHEFEANAGRRGTRFATDKAALPFVKPNHRVVGCFLGACHAIAAEPRRREASSLA